MKRYLVFFLLFLGVGSLFAQKARVKNDSGYDEHRFHFGFALGLNILDFAFQRPPIGINATDNHLYADVSSVQPGFQINVVTDFRLGQYLNLRIIPGINIGSRTISFRDYSATANPDFVSSMTIESNYADLPILLKYKAMRINNFRPYIIGGFSVKYDWAARKGYDESAKVFVRLKPFDYYLEFGVGVDQYLPFFKFTTELRVAIGLNDILVKKPAEVPGSEIYPRSINKLSSRLVTLNFYFE